MQTHTPYTNKFEWKAWFMLIPFILAIGIAPLFLHYSVVQYPALPVTWKQGPYVTADLFAYGKHYLILTAGFLSAIYLFFHVKHNPLKESSKKIPVGLIAISTVWLLLTSMTAIFPYGALWGALEKYEGTFIWLSYLALAVYAGSLWSESKFQTRLLRIVLFSGLVITGIGLTQFVGHDIIRMPWFLKTIMPKEVAETASFAFEINRVYSTLYNPNFVAMYVATVFPITCFMIYKEKSPIFKGLWAILSILLIVNLIGSKSSGGFVGLGLSIAVLVYMLFTKHFDLKKIKFASLLLVASSLIVLILFMGGTFNTLLGISKFTPVYNLTNVTTNEFMTTFSYKGKQLIVQADPNTLDSVRLFNADQVQLNVNANEDGTYSIISPDFADIQFTTGLTENKMAYVNFIIDGSNWVFLLHPNGMMYVNNLSTTVQIEDSKAFGGFVGHENFGSARGYIWSRTLPLIAASPIVGYGADNFTVAFPQNDYNMKYQLYGTPGILVDKAHNILLQWTMNFGLVGLALLLAVIGYSVKTLYLAYYNQKEDNYQLNLVIILCIFGYLGAGLFYDSNLHVSPFFWTFVGFGFKDLFKA